jgi:riboflavin kinase/FMN adenylyltransferase
MDVIGGDCRLPARLAGGALALGNFDGVHRGHQAVIGAALAVARAEGRPALVATFEPHPSRWFRPDTPPFALTTTAQKLRLFEALGLDAAVVIPFDGTLAAQSARGFAEEWLRQRLKLSHVATGTDFSFGRGREGNAATLAALGHELGFTTVAVEPVTEGGEPVSSTRIRAALADGRPDLAEQLLTRPFTIEAPVVHGDKRGRSIGVPTANQLLGAYARPRYGVYAVRACLPDGSAHDGVANLGIRPMFTPPRELLETWILDWRGDLYGQTLAVELIAYLRPEAQFDGLADLQAQIARDAEAARVALG